MHLPATQRNDGSTLSSPPSSLGCKTVGGRVDSADDNPQLRVSVPVHFPLVHGECPWRRAPTVTCCRCRLAVISVTSRASGAVCREVLHGSQTVAAARGMPGDGPFGIRARASKGAWPVVVNDQEYVLRIPRPACGGECRCQSLPPRPRTDRPASHARPRAHCRRSNARVAGTRALRRGLALPTAGCQRRVSRGTHRYGRTSLR
jgi:hypothetical protein